MAPEVAAPETIIEDVLIADYGDGVSLEAASGAVTVRRAWLRDLHDDAIENDFAESITVEHSLIERAFMAFASRPRSRNPLDQAARCSRSATTSSCCIASRTHTSRSPGTADSSSGRRTARAAVRRHGQRVRHGRPGTGQLALPLENQIAECRNNKLLWAGSVGAYHEWLADGGGHTDGMRNNRARLAALSRCYAVVVKPFGQPKEAFLAEHWDPLVARWKSANAAGRAAAQAPTGAGSDSTGSSSSSQTSR